MKKKILIRAFLGAPIGVTISLLITIVFSLCIGYGRYYPAPPELINWCGNETTAVILQMICALFVGAVCSASSVIWEVEQWSLLKQTIIHFVVISVPFFGGGYIMNWLPHQIYGGLAYAAGFILVYLIMWFSIYLTIKSKVKNMNKQLQEIQQQDTK